MHETRPYFRASPFAAARPDSKVERVAAGKETLDDHSCRIEDVAVTSAQPGASPVKMRLWEAEDLQGFPIRIDIQRGTGHATIRYKNVVLGPQDPTLFIHPKTCESIAEQLHPKTPKAAPTVKKPATTPAPANSSPK